MIPRIPADPAHRAERKQDLLLASTLLRGQAAAALDDLGERADVWGRRWQWLRAQWADPWVQAASRLGAALLAGRGPRRGRWTRWLRWGWVAWRAWRAGRAGHPR